MRKKLLVIILTLLVLLSGTVLGLSAVYRVNDVTVNLSCVTHEAREEGEKLQKALEETYYNHSMFFANEEEAQEVLEQYPYFRLSSFEKSYPKRLMISVTENAEIYAVEKEAGKQYLILGADGTLLEIRDTHVNALNGEENVLIKGVTVTENLGEIPTGDHCFATILTMCQSLSNQLDGIRRNVVSIEVTRRTPEVVFKVTMREGVVIYFNQPASYTEEKVVEAVSVYRSLQQDEKLTGRIYILEREGEILSQYSPVDEFSN